MFARYAGEFGFVSGTESANKPAPRKEAQYTKADKGQAESDPSEQDSLSYFLNSIDALAIVIIVLFPHLIEALDDGYDLWPETGHIGVHGDETFGDVLKGSLFDNWVVVPSRHFNVAVEGFPHSNFVLDDIRCELMEFLSQTCFVGRISAQSGQILSGIFSV